MTATLARPISAIRLDGGRPCIDFVNTIHNRFAADAEDYISTPERYVQWVRRAGALGPGEDADVSDLGAQGDRLMADVRSLRDAVFRLLSAWVDQVPLPEGPLSVENHWLMLARQTQRLAGNGLLTWRAEPGDLHIPLKRIALDVVETLADSRAGKLKLKCCANHTSCGWLFADTSKNGRRRWCSMETCGTLSKMATRRGHVA